MIIIKYYQYAISKNKSNIFQAFHGLQRHRLPGGEERLHRATAGARGHPISADAGHLADLADLVVNSDS